MKACIDCKFVDRFSYNGQYGCDRLLTYAEVADPVLGGTKRIATHSASAYRDAAKERSSCLPWRCGPKGRYFQPKDTR